MRLLLSASQTLIDTDPQADARASEAFARDDAIAFEDAFADDVCRLLDRACAGAAFVAEDIDKLGPRLFEAPARTALILRGILNRPALRDWIANITGCGPLVDVQGATARFVAGTGQRLDWHTDLDRQPRRLGITIGLGHAPYEGGLFEMRHRDSDAAHFRFDHVRPFTLLIFRVGPTLVHRVTPVTAGGPRTVFGGWFLGPPS